MTDLDARHSDTEIPMLQPALNQRPSFLRWNDPIGRLAFLAHWLLSLILLIAPPLVVFWLGEVFRLGAMTLLLTVLALLPAVQLYCVSVRRRLLSMGAKPAWLMLVFLFLAVSAFNALDGAMRAGQAELVNTPTINPMINALLLLPAVVLHFVLLLRRGAPKSHASV